MNSIIELNNTQVSRDGKTVIDGISAQVMPGDVIGLLGLNGAGKTTLLEAALGFLPTPDNSIKLFGHTPQQMTNQIKQQIGFVPQQDELPPNLRGKQYLQLIGGFYTQWSDDLVAQLASTWQIDLNAKISTMSVGQRQKLSIISALAHNPQLLVLDEPVASLDPVARREFLQTIAGVACEPTNAILFSTHIVTDLERVANRVWMIKDGKLLLDMSIDDLKEQVAVVEFKGSIGEAKLPSELARRTTFGNTRVCVSHLDAQAMHQIETSVSTRPERLDLSLEDLMLEIHA